MKWKGSCRHRAERYVRGTDGEPTGENVTLRFPVNFLPYLQKFLRCLVEEMERNGKRKQNTSASCNIEGPSKIWVHS